MVRKIGSLSSTYTTRGPGQELRIVSLLDQKTGKASAKKPWLLTARQAAVVEVKLERELHVEEISAL